MSVVPKPLDDRYEVIRPLGTGGMTRVFEAWDRHEGRAVAVKIPVSRLAGDMAFVARLRREARAVAELTHPNVAAVHGVEWQGPTGFVVTELVDGSSLWDMVASRGPMPPAGAAMVAAQACAALAAAHDRGLTHGHLTSANVLLCDDGRVKLTDFRLAQAARPGAAVPAPEEDVRALGRCMVLMLSGWEPAGEEQVRLHPEVPAELAAIVARAAGDPELGYRTAGELGRDLVRFLAGVRPGAALAKPPYAARAQRPADLSAMALSRAVALMRSLGAGSPGEAGTAGAPPLDRRRRWLGVLAGLVGAWLVVGAVVAVGLLGGDADRPGAAQVLAPPTTVVVATSIPTAASGTLPSSGPAAAPGMASPAAPPAVAPPGVAPPRMARPEMAPAHTVPPGTAPRRTALPAAPAPTSPPGSGPAGGPSLRTVPDLVGLRSDQAVGALHQAGLRARLVVADGRGPGSGRRVIAQDPSAGRAVPARSVVTVLLGTGKPVP